jgi:hypothetical protein
VSGKLPVTWRWSRANQQKAMYIYIQSTLQTREVISASPRENWKNLQNIWLRRLSFEPWNSYRNQGVPRTLLTSHSGTEVKNNRSLLPLSHTSSWTTLPLPPTLSRAAVEEWNVRFWGPNPNVYLLYPCFPACCNPACTWVQQFIVSAQRDVQTAISCTLLVHRRR